MPAEAQPTTIRRALLTSLAAMTMPLPTQAATRRLFLGARAGTDRFYATDFDLTGRIAFDLPLPGRGHGIAVRPGGDEAVFFSRRPGDFLAVVEIATGCCRETLPAAAGRWLNGHGAFAADGRLLFATETVGETGDGVVGVYDAEKRYRRIGEFAPGGLDPHDIRLLPDGPTLVVANGGVLTLSLAPRVQVNIDDMHPVLTYPDSMTGRIGSEHRLATNQQKIGIRHLAVAADGTVAVAMQYAGPSGDAVPLLGLHHRDRAEIMFIDLPPPLLGALRGYCGSAAIDEARGLLAVASPRGSIALFWDLTLARCLGSVAVADGCGVVADSDGGFLVGSGIGGMHRMCNSLAA